jgi:hypothetical protein
MGIILKPICKCEEAFRPMFLGGGMMNHNDYAYLPYYCDECKEIKKGNVLKCKCSVCRKEMTLYGRMVGYFSDDESDRFYNPENIVFDWTIGMDLQYILENKKCHCPSCKNDNLEFENVGMWD